MRCWSAAWLSLWANCWFLAAGLHGLNIIEQYALVTFRVHLFIDFAQHTLRIDHERGAVPVHRAFVIALAHAGGLQQFMVRISKQIDRKRKLVTKVLVRVDLVFADADNSDIRVV